jgi:ABC-type glycerol-3-phosphate transport system substrate-binding protein
MYTRFGEALDIFGQAVSEIISGDKTPQEAMDLAQQEAEARLEP